VIVGEVRWIDLPARGGRAQAGRRPAIIMQSISSFPTSLIVLLTSQLDTLRFAGAALVEADARNEMRCASVALVCQLTAVDNHSIAGRLGTVSSEMLKGIWIAFDTLIGRA